MKEHQKAIQLKYLPINEQDASWGLTTNSVGFQSISRGESYPPRNHPTRYLFSADRGRVLEEFQLLYIVKGRGTFKSKELKKTEIKEGHMFMLFPAEWHTYFPCKKTGWDEYWIGFSGKNIKSIVENKFFKTQKPIFNVGIQDDIVSLYKQAIRVAIEQKSGYQQMLAGIVNLLLGYAYSYDRFSIFEDLQVVNQINKAKIMMAENFNMGINPKEIAEKVNMSYSWFRRIFKQYTGFAPAQYIQKIKINKSKELLTNSNLRIKEIALDVGFSNTECFCTIFKKHTDYTPNEYREFTQGKNL
ncbi:helix-turn-helix domain-containing protein [Dysgonomonas sp. Marseille-P4677]|uniref:AraC family transcriptional regulator n=1 Tax=Dysgonomonas sp. Marseille-P4677 TaxID=2364790 RepID=UPI0019138582|nr:AraC family transcriptional regulator [Dysgonomonas sp. Marseille-P4677]MBK5719854.1 helix-turn-helix domain-containing protein [Dysgonomonas sp. Marseille-P4677]